LLIDNFKLLNVKESPHFKVFDLNSFSKILEDCLSFIRSQNGKLPTLEEVFANNQEIQQEKYSTPS